VKAVQFTAILVAMVILGGLTAALFDVRALPRFSEVSGTDGTTVWRLDNRTGRVSVCGSAMTGQALAQAESRLAANIRSTGGNPVELRTLDGEVEQLDSLSRPRCSPWSFP
jgi:hypothetical protein